MRSEEEKKLRFLLAYQHTHLGEYPIMYYDDGEASCSTCGCDFIRDSSDELLGKIKRFNLKLYESRTRPT